MEIKASAANALSDWQTFFAGKSLQRAKEIALASGAGQVSREHLVKAALEIIDTLRMEIQPNEAENDDRRAA